MKRQIKARMNRIIENIFQKRTIIFDRLQPYGFAYTDGKYTYDVDICDGQMNLSVTVDGEGNIDTQVVELDTQDIYTLFLVEDAVGSFVGFVRAEYTRVMTDIADKCCERQVFKSSQARSVIEYIRQKYGDELEFLWEKFDDNAIWRRKDNRKWYALLVVLSRRKLGFDSDGKVDIINVRIDPQKVADKVDNVSYFLAYHMNKKSWLTVCLDGSAPLEEIFELIDDSYELARKK